MDKVIENFEKNLPRIIQDIAKKHNIKEFSENPDYFDERLKKWHQFGLLTHTRLVKSSFDGPLKVYLRKWKIDTCLLDEEIDKIAKKDLLGLSMILHDLGKILVYGKNIGNREHEAHSKSLILSFLKPSLVSSGLSEVHISYIARCAETHDVIGKEMRDVFKHENNLNLAYLESPRVVEMCKQVSRKYSDVKMEIGIFYLCDSLGKTDIVIDAESDEAMLKKEGEIAEILDARKLPPELKHAVFQLPCNLKLAQIYLRNIV